MKRLTRKSGLGSPQEKLAVASTDIVMTSGKIFEGVFPKDELLHRVYA
jgi:hypothetical protein